MIYSFEEILQEAIYNSRKIYYHVSYNNFDHFENKNNYRKGDETAGGVFLTPNLYMIQEYTARYLMDKFSSAKQYYLYRCMINKELNIFNPSNREDREKFQIVVEENPKQFMEDFAMNTYKYVPENLEKVLKNLFNLDEWQDAENPAVTKIVKALGYDGYESTENNVANILVFNAENVKIIPTTDKDGDFESYYWKIVPNDEKKTRQFFKELGIKYVQADNQRHRSNATKNHNFKNLKDTSKADIFGMQIYDYSRGFEFAFYDLSDCFNSKGALIKDSLETEVSAAADSLKEFKKDNPENDTIVIKYNNKYFSNKEDLLYYITGRYEVDDSENEEDMKDHWVPMIMF